MKRFHLNIYNDIDVEDEDGTEYVDLAAAKVAAIAGARALMAEHLQAGKPINLAHRVEVSDDDGTVLATLPFRELITIVDVERT